MIGRPRGETPLGERVPVSLRDTLIENRMRLPWVETHGYRPVSLRDSCALSNYAGMRHYPCGVGMLGQSLSGGLRPPATHGEPLRGLPVREGAYFTNAAPHFKVNCSILR